jgi:hypothetical protein
MRRLLISIAAIPILLLTLAGTAAAAPPLRESGTQVSFSSQASACSTATCTDTYLDVYNADAQTYVVCLTSYTYSIRTGRLISEESGCTETSSAVLSITDDFTVTLTETPITLFECNQRTCSESDTITVSAQDSAIGPVATETGRGTFSDGTCTYRYSTTSESALVAGTMTIDGVTVDQSGFAYVSEFTVSTRCR